MSNADDARPDSGTVSATAATSPPAPPAPRSALEQIDHLVVLMLENRSFDNMLGWLYDGEQLAPGQHFDGLHESMWNPFDNVDPDGVHFVERVPVRKNGAPRGYRAGDPTPASTPDFTLPNPDPGEGYKDTNQQLFGHLDVPAQFTPPPLNQGFVENYAAAMRYSAYQFHETPTDPRDILVAYTPEQLPVLSQLAKSFAVCDRWHCSVPSQTLPNRAFVHAATSDGCVNNSPAPNFSSPTIFNRLQDAIDAGADDLSWAVYSGTEAGNAFSLTRLMMRALHDARFDPNFKSIGSFYDDAKAGTLPSYSFLEPQFHPPGQNDQHPNSDVRAGEQLIAQVYNAVVDSPAWEKTLLIITYDEHGGCFDHVAPPAATPPEWLSLPGDDDGAPHPDRRDGPPGQFGFSFNRLGVRVPTVVVSPWIAEGTVARPAGFTPFDHTTVIATVRKRFGLSEPLTHRDEFAPDLGCVLTLATARVDRPTVQPLPLPADPIGPTAPNDLHRFSEELLTAISGRHRPAEADIIDWTVRTFDALFRRT